MKKHQMDNKEGQKTKVLRLPKRLGDKPTINIPFDKTQFTELDNILWWYKIQNNIPCELEDRVTRLIDHIRNYSR